MTWIFPQRRNMCCEKSIGSWRMELKGKYGNMDIKQRRIELRERPYFRNEVIFRVPYRWGTEFQWGGWKGWQNLWPPENTSIRSFYSGSFNLFLKDCILISWRNLNWVWYFVEKIASSWRFSIEPYRKGIHYRMIWKLYSNKKFWMGLSYSFTFGTTKRIPLKKVLGSWSCFSKLDAPNISEQLISFLLSYRKIYIQVHITHSLS